MTKLCYSICFVVPYLSLCFGLKVIFVPLFQIGETDEFYRMATELQSRGHDITFFSGKSHQQRLIEHGFKTIDYDDDGFINTEELSRHLMSNSQISSTKVSALYSSLCRKMVTPDNLKRLKMVRYDVTVVSVAPVSMCNYIISRHIGARYISSAINPIYFLARIPSLPVTPFHDFPGGVPLNMTFSKRLLNLLTTSYYEVHRIPNFFDLEPYKKLVQFDSVSQIAENSSAWLFQQDFLLQQVYAFPPHVVHVGGQNTKTADSLPNDLQSILDDAQEGAIVVHFGDAFSYVDRDVTEKLLDALQRVSQKVIMQIRGNQPTSTNPKIVVRESIVLNDILNHPNVKLLITHSGNDDQFTALYHGIPMICFHVCCDQHINAARVVKRGYGLRMNLWRFTTDELIININNVISSPSYSKNIKKASGVYLKQPHPALKAADTVEQVAKGEFDMLYPSVSYKLNFIQFYNFDVIATIIFMALMCPIMLLYVCCRCVCGRKKISLPKAKEA